MQTADCPACGIGCELRTTRYRSTYRYRLLFRGHSHPPKCPQLVPASAHPHGGGRIYRRRRAPLMRLEVTG